MSVVLVAVLGLPAAADRGLEPAGNRRDAGIAPGDPVATASPAVRVAADTEAFREQILVFLEQADEALAMLRQRQALDAGLGRLPAGVGTRVSPSAYEYLKTAPAADLEEARRLIASFPEFLSAPALLQSSLAVLPDSTKAVLCEDEYTERAKLVALTDIRNGLIITADVFDLVTASVELIKALGKVVVTICEDPLDIPLSSTAIVLIIIWGVSNILSAGLHLLADGFQFAIINTRLCIDSCVGHGFSDHHFPDTNAGLVGKGCDNRDNDCAGGIDEALEDRVAPNVSIDSTLTGECYRNLGDADQAVALAVKAADDCYAVTPDIDFTYIETACLGLVSARATDGANNLASSGPVSLTIDPHPPTFNVAPLGNCYPSLASARTAFAATQVVDCTDVETRIDAVESACVADLELEAIDECGNRASTTVSVRLDGTPPEVFIDAIFVPRVDGLACFDDRDEAVEIIGEATTFGDDCSDTEDMTLSTQAGGEDCNLVVTSMAVDECGQAASDSIRARADATAPVVACEVAEQVLWPADDRMVDVGFSYSAGDNCDGTDLDVRVLVTSDEATAFGLTAKDENGGEDIAPDAILERDGSGNVSGIRLRAQRRQTNSYDGRIYRIRVVATDSCGLSGHADCFVAVPHSLENGTGTGRVVNSGQAFDATGVN